MWGCGGRDETDKEKIMIKVICGGGRNERWVEDVVREYGKRMGRYWQVEWRVVAEEKLYKVFEELTDGNRWKNVQKPYVVLLDERGKMLDSPGLGKMLGEKVEMGRDVVFVIGGAYGFGEEDRNRVDLVWSLSALVFPHQMCRAILAEQIYRAQEIYLGRPYHHE